MWHQAELWIFSLLRNRIGRIRDDEPARATSLGLDMTNEALIGVVPRPSAIRIAANLRKLRIKLARNRGTVRYVVAVVAGGL